MPKRAKKISLSSSFQIFSTRWSSHSVLESRAFTKRFLAPSYLTIVAIQTVEIAEESALRKRFRFSLSAEIIPRMEVSRCAELPPEVWEMVASKFQLCSALQS